MPPVLCTQGPLHRTATFARAQRVRHIIRQESIFNISEHHNPRQGTRGGSESRIYQSHGWAQEKDRKPEIERQTAKKQRTREKEKGKTHESRRCILLRSAAMQKHANQHVPFNRKRRECLMGAMIPFLAGSLLSVHMCDNQINFSGVKHTWKTHMLTHPQKIHRTALLKYLKPWVLWTSQFNQKAL